MSKWKQDNVFDEKDEFQDAVQKVYSNTAPIVRPSFGSKDIMHSFNDAVFEESLVLSQRLIEKAGQVIATEYATADDLLKVAKMIESVQVSIGRQRKFSTDILHGQDGSEIKDTMPTAMTFNVVDAS